jgi:hypothetical protein
MMIRKGTLCFSCALLAASVTLAGDEIPKAPPRMGSGYPSPVPPSARSAEVKAPATPRDTTSSADAGPLKELVLQAIAEGKAQVSIAGRARLLQPGDAVAGYVVGSISGRRIVLTRTIQGQVTAEATAVVTFDASGKARVRVYSTKDLTVPPSGPRR